jgi:hypothetical protein
MILAADFGGTTIKPGLVRDGCILGRSRLHACANRPMWERLEAVACEWESLLKTNGFTLQIGSYTIRPHGPSVGRECATMKALIRT